MKKILILTTQINYGAAELLDVSLFHELKALGFSVDLMSIYAKEYAYLESTDEINFPGVYYLGLKPGYSKISLIYYTFKLTLLIYLRRYYVLQTSLRQVSFLGALARFFSGCHQIVGIHEVYSEEDNNSLYERLMPYLFSKKKTLFY